MCLVSLRRSLLPRLTRDLRDALCMAAVPSRSSAPSSTTPHHTTGREWPLPTPARNQMQTSIWRNHMETCGSGMQMRVAQHVSSIR